MGIVLPSESADYIAHNVRDNVRQIEGILKSLNAYSSLNKEAITPELVKTIVGGVVTAPKAVSGDLVLKTVASHTGIPPRRCSAREGQAISLPPVILQYTY